MITSKLEKKKNLAYLTSVRSAAAATKTLQSCLTLSNPMDCSLPGFSMHGIFWARVLEWVAIAFVVCEK